MVTRQDTRRTAFGHGLLADAALASLVMLIVGMMIVPLPTWLLDLLIAANLAFSILLLVTALYVPHGLAFTSLPSVLLISTLYRLALNVSSTRLILLQADAGRVIRAFGEFVVRGDYVVGAVVFSIISLIQYLVVAKGGERVAEVAARFTLDALPGKQLAIDAELRTGALRVEAARERRALLERESQFFGAMDGAMKFVKGDAIASLVITSIALLGGAAIGLGSRGMSLRATLQLYGLLAIGDGLVSQLPALITSIAAGLVVTRVAAHGHTSSLGQDLVAQLFERPRTWAAASVCLLALAIVPGLPAAPFAVLCAVAGVVAFGLRRAHAERLRRETADESGTSVLRLELGSQLAQPSALHEVVTRETQRIALQLGLPQLNFRIALGPGLEPREFVVRLREAPVLRGQAANAQEMTQLVAAELPAILRRRARELLGLEDVQRLLDSLSERAPALVRSAVPKPLSLAQLTEVLRALLDEGVSVRAFERIVESLATSAEREFSADNGLLRARRAVRDELIEPHLHAGVLAVHRIDPLIEDAVRDASHSQLGERVVALQPELARDIVAAVKQARARHAQAPVLVTQLDVRRGLRDTLAEELPDVTVLAYAELPPGTALEEREPISL